MFVMWLSMPHPSGRAHSVSRVSYGVVRSVDDCRAAKHSLHCLVRTERSAYELDVTRFPGNIVQPGDELFTERRNWTLTKSRPDVRHSYLCKNDQCEIISTCWSWMSCWEAR